MRAEIDALLERGFGAWNRHDAAGLAAGFTEDAVMRVIATGDVARGRGEISALAEERLRAFPDWRLERRGTYDCGKEVWAEWGLTGTHEREFMGIPGTRRRVDLLGCSLFSLDPDGLVAEETIYFDAATMLRQLGLLAEPRATQAATPGEEAR